jgi:hypothetical protein
MKLFSVVPVYRYNCSGHFNPSLTEAGREYMRGNEAAFEN